MPDERMESRPVTAAAAGLARAVRERFTPDPALVARGARHVRQGVAVAAVGALSMLVLDFAADGRLAMRVVGYALFFALLFAGLLRGTHGVRPMAGVVAAGCIASPVVWVLSRVFTGYPSVVPHAQWLGWLLSLIVAAGLCRAVLGDAVSAWFASHEAARAERRPARSLDEWRRRAR